MAVPALIGGINTTLELYNGTAWIEVPGVADVSASGGEAPETDIVTFEGVAKATGHARVPSFSVQVPLYNPLVAAFRYMRDNAGSRISFRLTTEESVVQDFGSTTLAIVANTGVATLSINTAAGSFAGWEKDDRVKIGMVIKPDSGSDRYTLESITSNTEAVVSGVSSNVSPAASTFELVIPALRDSFVGTVRSGSSYELPAEGGMNKTLSITPTGPLENWSIQ